MCVFVVVTYVILGPLYLDPSTRVDRALLSPGLFPKAVHSARTLSHYYKRVCCFYHVMAKAGCLRKERNWLATRTLDRAGSCIDC